jgi:hypothetical protein
MEIFNTRLASTLLPLSREGLSDYTNLVLKFLKIYMTQRLGQHIDNLFICANIIELCGYSLHHIKNVMILDFYVFLVFMEHEVLYRFYETMVIT